MQQVAEDENDPNVTVRSTVSAPQNPIESPRRSTCNISKQVSGPSLIKQALLNCQTIASRRKSISHPFNVPDSMNPKVVLSRRISLGNINKTNANIDKESSYVDPRPIVDGNQSASKKNMDNSLPPDSPVQKDTQVCREELLRAISTPQANLSVINNITFINNTQEISAINPDQSNTSVQCSEPDKSRDTIVLHFKSPEAFAKDDEFSRIRRASAPRKSLNKDFDKADDENANQKDRSKRGSGGFMEEVSSCDISEDSDFLEVRGSRCKKSNDSTSKIPKKEKSKVKQSEDKSKTKRTREMSSLSPDPLRDNENEQADVVIKKNTKTKIKKKLKGK